MEAHELRKRMSELFNARLALMTGKSHDYADEDALSNFKRLNILCKTLDIDTRRSPGDCARFLVMLKIDRWHNLLRKKVAPASESVQDTMMDLANYIDLAEACDTEKVCDALE